MPELMTEEAFKETLKRYADAICEQWDSRHHDPVPPRVNSKVEEREIVICRAYSAALAALQTLEEAKDGH